MASTSDKSPKEWWSLLRDLKSNAKWEDPDHHVSLEDLTSFFCTLYKDASLETDAQSNPDLTFTCSDYFRSTNPPKSVLEDPLEQPLTSSKLSQVIKRLPLGKATVLDNVSNEMLRLVGPLSITSCLGKLFTGALNERLMAFMIRKNIAHPFQGAFTRDCRGTYHIFLANTLIDQAKSLGHPLYAAFIDLQKAYNSVCRPLLFRKMVMAGLGPKFCNIVEDMYVSASYRIKMAVS